MDIDKTSLLALKRKDWTKEINRVMLELGFKNTYKFNPFTPKKLHDFREQSVVNCLIYTSDDVYILIEIHGYKDEGSNDFEYKIKWNGCPKNCFDRWANSRNVVGQLYPGWKDYVSNITKLVNDIRFFCKTVPEDYFNRFIRIEL